MKRVGNINETYFQRDIRRTFERASNGNLKDVFLVKLISQLVGSVPDAHFFNFNERSIIRGQIREPTLQDAVNELEISEFRIKEEVRKAIAILNRRLNK